ncbi:DUF1643 domain-containing protein [Cryobacterium sandaracinum]|uniref:DUF1643 domain-containing protein n=1 Tax=Cryobacterium sandaracinum TaxID=1259247 RepID=A0ABY2JBJ0_9MICO|nr:DUF1643 domain-containing protein [Cryobacterium sandaracinum]
MLATILPDGLGPDRVLGAILLNPPTTGGAATLRHLAAAAVALDCCSIAVANMFPLPTKSVDQIGPLASDMQSWIQARDAIELLVGEADVVIAAWGVSGLSGAARRNMGRQVSWLVEELDRQKRTIWTVGPLPRHPSRWHQYVSDKYGRAGSGTLAERLGRVLVESEPGQLVS